MATKDYTFKVQVGQYLLRPASYDDAQLLEKAWAHKRNNEPVWVTISLPDERQEWIDRWYDKACKANVNVIKVGKSIVVTQFGKSGGFYTYATASLHHDDTYDYRTGVAVAYAKLCKARVPAFI